MINHGKKSERKQKSEMGLKETILKGCFSSMGKPAEKHDFGISSHYEVVTENKTITFFKWALMAALTMSFVISAVVLCVDVDLLKNGPTYFLSKLLLWMKQSEESSNYEEENIYKELIGSRRALWIQMPMMGVLIGSATVVFMSILGCVAAATLSYTLIIGFSAFMFIATVTSSFLLIWGFYGDIEGTVTDRFAMKKISEYFCPNVDNIPLRDDLVCDDSFNRIIDYVQMSMNCCGFKSGEDWGDLYPSSCCPPCTDQSSSCDRPCFREEAYPTPCIDSIRKSALRLDTFVGRIGITMVGVVSLLGINFIISFILFVLVRARHSRGLQQECQLELADNYYGRNSLYSSDASNTLLEKYNSIGIDRTKRNPNILRRDMTTTSDLLQSDADTTYTPSRRKSAFY